MFAQKSLYTPTPTPSVQPKVSRAKTDLIPGFSQWEAMSNKILPYFQQLTTTHFGQVTFLLQSAKTNSSDSLAGTFFHPFVFGKQLLWHFFCSTDLVSSLDNGQHGFNRYWQIFPYHSVVQKLFSEPNYIFIFLQNFISEQIFKYSSFDTNIP